MFSPTVFMSTIPVHDEDTGMESVMHVAFTTPEAYASFLADLTADGLDVSDITLAEVPSTWECSGRDGCTVSA